MTRAAKKDTKPRTDALDQAARQLRAGKLDAALELYQQLYDQNPHDWTVANALGDLYVRMKQNDEAIEVFMSLAEHMAGQGHSVKARALYRKVLRMRPGDEAAMARVAELDNEHLDASPFMQRVRGVLLDAQAAATPAVSEAVEEPTPAPAPGPELIKLVTSAPIPVSRFGAPDLEPPPAIEAEPEPPARVAPAPVPVVRFEPVATPEFSVDLDARPAAPPAVAEIESRDHAEPVEDVFELRSDDWLPAGLSLAAAPLVDHPVKAGGPDRLAAFQRMETTARRAAGAGDFRTAAFLVDSFLETHTNDIEALELLVGFGVDGHLDSTAASQIRLADACVAAGRLSSARNIALDLLHRAPGDPHAVALADRVFAARSTVHETVHEPARVHAPQTGTLDSGVEFVELFDDDGLVTDGGRSAAEQEEPERSVNPLDDWLDAVDESDAHEAVTAAERLSAVGNVEGAMATLEPLMKSPGLRPIVGVHLAQLYRQAGDCGRALQCLEQAAEQPPVSEDNAHALAYELALTLEVMGQRTEALGLYRELLSEVGPAFRDVAARAEHLSAA